MEENDIRAKLKEESERIASRLSAIGGEKTGKNQELEEERENLKKLEDERRQIRLVLLQARGQVRSFNGIAEEEGRGARERSEDARGGDDEPAGGPQVNRGRESRCGGIYEDLWKRLEALRDKIDRAGRSEGGAPCS